jgi:hypothetical protein
MRGIELCMPKPRESFTDQADSMRSRRFLTAARPREIPRVGAMPARIVALDFRPGTVPGWGGELDCERSAPWVAG